MRTPHSKRALTLASALVATGLALASAPHALAAGTDGNAVLKLTGTQARKLADHMGVDVYGDRQVSDDASGGQAPTDRTSGASGGSSGSGSHIEDAASGTTATDTPVTFTEKSTMEGVRGLGVTVPAKGASTSPCTAWATSSCTTPTAPPRGRAPTPRCTRTGRSSRSSRGAPSRTRPAS